MAWSNKEIINERMEEVNNNASIDNGGKDDGENGNNSGNNSHKNASAINWSYLKKECHC
jgi:hypothetical protein